jgi:hypothetical protein
MYIEADQNHLLTFVLPVTIREAGSNARDLEWRQFVDRNAQARLHMLFDSFLQFFAMEDLHSFLVICPDPEIPELASLLASKTDDPRFRILPESEILPDIEVARDPETGQMRGWYVQQLLKLAAAFRVQTDFYVPIDSDIVCVRPFGYDALIEGNRAAAGIETDAFYRTLYTDSFAAVEVHTKESRLGVSAGLLGYERAERYQGRYYSETPVVFATDCVRSLCDHLSDRSGEPWVRCLAKTPGWAEISLYFQFLEMTSDLDRFHTLHGPNRVMHVESSVWQPTWRYRCPRRYDRAHFTDHLRQDAEGVFVAIQSWIDPDQWLPQSGCKSLPEFYRRLRSWLGLPPEPSRSIWNRLAQWLKVKPGGIQRTRPQ